MCQSVHSSIIYNLPKLERPQVLGFPVSSFPHWWFRNAIYLVPQVGHHLQCDQGGDWGSKVKGELYGKVKWTVSHRDQEDMGWVRRDSPEGPETRASRSPEREVSRLRYFPKGNTEKRAPRSSLVFKDLRPPVFLLASSLASLPSAVAPPTQSSFPLWHSVAPHCLLEKIPNSSAQHSKHFRILSPAFPLPRSAHPGLQVHQLSYSFSNISIHLASTPWHVLFQPPELSTRPGWLSASYSVSKIQFKCHLLCKSLTSPKSMSHSFLWCPSLHQSTLLMMF